MCPMLLHIKRDRQVCLSLFYQLVPEVGIEPTRICPRRILSLIKGLNTIKLYIKKQGALGSFFLFDTDKHISSNNN